MVLYEEYQGGATTTLVINHAGMDDNGTYQLKAENRNGVEKVDLDLIVLDSDHHDCDFFKNGDNTCTCTLSYNGYAAYVALMHN